MGKIACPKCGNGMSDKRTICEDCEAASEGKEAYEEKPDYTKKGDSYEKEAYEEKPDYTKKGDSYEKEETDEGEK